MVTIETLKCAVLSSVFKNPTTGYGVLVGKTDSERISLVGDLAAIATGTALEVQGEWKTHPKYGKQSIAVIKENPYRLADEVPGIGFLTADKLAMGMGIDRNSYIRLRSGVLYVMHEITNNGHVYATRTQIVDKAIDLLGVDEVRLQATLDDMISTKEIVSADKEVLYLKPLYYAEKGIASNLKRLLLYGKKLPVNIPGLEAEMSVTYDPAQANAIQYAMDNRVMVLTGGPGTGKTTVTRGIIAALEGNDLDIQLAAPTGRAAKRMEEATGMQSQTIHRLLESNKDGEFTRNADNPIEGDVLIVDESSIDTENGALTVDFDGRTIPYEGAEMNDLALAYAVTIHKSQGSEYPIVVIPLHTTNFVMLERHLVYTGFSRAKQLLVVIGSKQAMLRAVQHEAATKRQTMLKEMLAAGSERRKK